jgi:hypothetical protein
LRNKNVQISDELQRHGAAGIGFLAALEARVWSSLVSLQFGID